MWLQRTLYMVIEAVSRREESFFCNPWGRLDMVLGCRFCGREFLDR